ncbi:MAG: hypothetical protein U1F60_09645 [Planctomycetota bacterium]
MNDSDDDSLAATPDRLDPADAAWLEAALHEVLAGEAPPDLRARLAAANASDLQAAAVRVEAARPARARTHWLLAAVALFALLVVGGVAALQRAGVGSAATPASAPQEPLRELEVGNVEQLAAHLARTTTVALTALRGSDGARLPNEPEHSGMLSDPLLRDLLRTLFVPGLAAGAPFERGAAHAELRLQSEAGFVRLFVLVERDAALQRDTVRLGNAKFATAAVPAEVSVACRAVWESMQKQQVQARRRLQVHTTRELIAAIGSDRTIELVGGPFVLDPEDEAGPFPDNPAVEFAERDPVPYLVVKGVRGLHLRAVGGPVRVLSRSPAEVVQFAGCRDVFLDGLVLGHSEEVAFHCVAPVLSLQQCTNVLVRDCELFGCGTEGIVAAEVDGLRMERGEIHTCRHGICILERCRGVEFRGAVFRDTEVAMAAFVFDACERVHFADCVVRNLDGGMGGPAQDQGLFAVTMDEAVTFVRGQIRGNRTRRVVNSKLLLVRDGTDEGDNGPEVVVERRGKAGGERR